MSNPSAMINAMAAKVVGSAGKKSKVGGAPTAPTLLLGAAAALGAAAVANALVARRSERRRPPTGAFINIDGIRLHYLEKGAGEPIVLVHGNGVTAEDWVVSGVFDLLAQTHRVIAFDRPGFGYSERPRSRIWTAEAQAELLRSALHRLGVERSTVVGHSWGSLVAMAMALDHPTEIARLVLMSGYYRPTPRLDVPLMSGPAVPVLGDVIRYTISPLMGWLSSPLLFKQLFAPGKVTPAFKAGFPLGLALRPSQIRASAADTALMVPEAAKSMNRHDELTMPVTIMAGDGDKIVSFTHQSQALAEEIPGSRLRVFEVAGHMIHHVAPGEVAALIAAEHTPLKAAA